MAELTGFTQWHRLCNGVYAFEAKKNLKLKNN